MIVEKNIKFYEKRKNLEGLMLYEIMFSYRIYKIKEVTYA
jgi:hypothetical protein